MDAIHIVCPECSAVNRIPAAKRGEDARCGKCKKALFEGRPVELSDESFDKFISRNDVPVVVDFWAPWCGPCRVMAPAYEQAAVELEPDVRLARVNTDEMQRTAAQFNIRSIPTIAVFKNGREVARQAGAMPLPQLLQWIRAQT